jgi:hypothetical protein
MALLLELSSGPPPGRKSGRAGSALVLLSSLPGGQPTGLSCRIVYSKYGELGTGFMYWFDAVGQPV